MSGKYPSELRTECSRHGRQLTKRASLAREAEKVGPNRGRCGIPDDSARHAALPERGAFRNYWPFRGVRTHPPSTRRRRVFVADKLGSSGRIRTDARLVNIAIQIGNDQ